MRPPTYDALLAIAGRNAWDPEAIALDGDRWDALAPTTAARLRGLVAGFVVGEDAVADHLAPLRDAADDPGLRACLAAQVAEEERHAHAVDRVWAGIGGGDPAAIAPPALTALFRERLPATVARAPEDLGGGVALYHGLLEGVIFLAGQRTLLALADGQPLPGLRETFARIERDERWHVALGARVLHDRPDGPALASRLRAEADAVADAWGPLVEEPVRREVAALVDRRLATIGLAAPA